MKTDGKKMIVQKVRRHAKVRLDKKTGTKELISRGTPIATLVAVKTNVNKIDVSWSKCHYTDHFDSKDGLEWALLRLNNPLLRKNIPYKIRKDLNKFIKRCSKYFNVDEGCIEVH